MTAGLYSDENVNASGPAQALPSYLVTDVDGDGRDDIITHHRMGNPGSAVFTDEWLTDPAIVGKKLSELNPLIKTPDVINMYVYRSTGTDFEKQSYPTRCFSNTAILADVDSDGRRDVVCCDRNALYINRVIGSGGFHSEERIARPEGTSCHNLMSLDVDGDGAEEALAFASGGLDAQVLMRSATGAYSWKNAGFPTGVAGSIYDTATLKASSCDDSRGLTCSYYAEMLYSQDLTGGMAGMMKLDVNGDGLQDIFYYGRLWINRGNGFVSGHIQVPPERVHYFDSDMTKLVAFDYDNDGRTDIVNWFSGEMLRASARGEMIHENIEESRCGYIADYATSGNPFPFYGGVTLADLNGDGNRDWVCNGLDTNGRYRAVTGVLWTRNTEVGALDSILDGVGKRYDISYRDDGRIGPEAALAYETSLPAAALPDTVRIRRVSPVVSGYRESQWMSSADGESAVVQNARHSFHYRNANAGLNGRGWYGFESMQEVVTNPSGELFERIDTTFNNRVFWNAGTVAEVVREHATVAAGIGHGAFTRFDLTTYEWQQYSTPWSRRGRFVALNWVRNTTFEGFDVLIDSQTSFEYDDFGNVTRRYMPTESYLGTQEDWSVETAVYLPLYNRWLVTNPGEVQVQRGFGSDVQRRKTSYSYYANGMLDTTTREPDSDAYRQTVKLVRDGVYSNVTETRVTDVTGATRSSTADYDERGRFPIRERNALGHPTEVQYDVRNGQLLTSMDPNGVISQIQYDLFGRKVRVVSPTEELTQAYKPITAAYGGPVGAFCVHTKVRGGPESKASEATFDATGALLMRATRGLESKTLTEEISRDWAGRVIAATLPHLYGDDSQGQRGFIYDPMGRVIREGTPDNRIIEYGYPTATSAEEPYASLFAASTQNPISATVAMQPNGRGEITITDRRGLPVTVGHWDETHAASSAGAVLDGSGALNTYRYNAMGQVVEVTDPDHESSVIGYDPIGRRTVTYNPTIGQRIYEYNGFDEVAKYTDAENHVSCHYYDVLGRPNHQIAGDASGNCTLNGDSIASFAYDSSGVGDNEIGRLVSAWRRARPGSTDGTTTTYRYEAIPSSGPNSGRIKSIEQQVPGLGTPLVTSVDYDGPWVSQIHYPSADGAAFAVRYGYDAVGAVKEVSDAISSKTYWAATEFDGGMRIKRELFGNDVETEYEYHGVALSAVGPRCIYGASLESCSPGAVHKMVTKRHSVPGALAQRNLEYEYDKLGLVSGVTTVRPSGERNNIVYENDYLGRLKNESHWTGGSRIDLTIWDYSNGGDITRIRNGVTGTTLQSYTYGDTTRRHLVTSMNDQQFGYNQNGSQNDRRGAAIPNSHQVLEYNEFEMPWRIGNSVDGYTELEYDAGQNRVAKRGPSKTTIYAGKLYECDGNTPGIGGTFACENHRYSVFANGKPVAVVTSDSLGDTTAEYIHSDHLGSSSMTTGEDGAVVRQRTFAAFGATTSAVGASPIRSGFTGHEHDDELGLINMRGRLYDPKLSRFISADPFVTSPFDTQGLNRYSYVRNSPLNLVDPSGFEMAPPPVTYVPCPSGGPGNVAVYGDGAGGVAGYEPVAPCTTEDIPKGYKPPSGSGASAGTATSASSVAAPTPSTVTSGSPVSNGSSGGDGGGGRGGVNGPGNGGGGGGGGGGPGNGGGPGGPPVGASPGGGGNGTLGNGTSYGSSGTLNAQGGQQHGGPSNAANSSAPASGGSYAGIGSQPGSGQPSDNRPVLNEQRKDVSWTGIGATVVGLGSSIVEHGILSNPTLTRALVAGVGHGALGLGAFVYGYIFLDRLQAGDKEGATKAAIDATMNVVGLFGPWGAAISVGYFAFDLGYSLMGEWQKAEEAR